MNKGVIGKVEPSIQLLKRNNSNAHALMILTVVSLGYFIKKLRPRKWPIKVETRVSLQEDFNFHILR